MRIQYAHPFFPGRRPRTPGQNRGRGMTLWGRWRSPISWFPGHMAKAMQQVRKRIRACDLVIEVRCYS